MLLTTKERLPMEKMGCHTCYLGEDSPENVIMRYGWDVSFVARLSALGRKGEDYVYLFYVDKVIRGSRESVARNLSMDDIADLTLIKKAIELDLDIHEYELWEQSKLTLKGLERHV